MKKLVPILLLPIVAALAVGVVASRLATQERLRNEVEAMVQAAIGRQPEITGDVSFSVFPWPAIEVGGLTIDDPQARLEVGEARIVLDLLPLLTGRASPDYIELTDADLTLADPGDSTQVLGALITGLGTAESDADLYVTDGSVKIARGEGGEMLIPQADMRIAWRGGRDVTAKGRATWRGEPLDIDLNLSGLEALASGGVGSLKLAVSGAPAELSFQGGARLAGGPVVTGTLALASRQLRDALEWLDLDAPTERGFGNFALNASAQLSAKGAVLGEARIELDGNAGVGGFNLRFDGGRATVQGSLASERLDLSPYGQLALSGAQGGTWNSDAIDLRRTRALDVDLRLSAQQVRAGDAELQRMAASATLKGGKLSLTIGEAEAWGGLFRAALHVSPLDKAAGAQVDGADVRLDLSADDVALARALGELFGMPRLEGNGSFRLSAGGSGASIMDIAANLNGTFTLSGEQGALVGIDVGRVLARLEKRPLSGAGDLRGGRTPYDNISIDASIQDGIAKLDRVDLTSAKLRVGLAGESSIAARDLDFAGTAQLVGPPPAEAVKAGVKPGSNPDAAVATPASFELPFIVRGDWERPIVLPDPQALIRRSGAARPLFGGPDKMGIAGPLP